jgi:hypothetical protein
MPNLLANPLLWADGDGNSPPSYWTPGQSQYQILNVEYGDFPRLIYIGPPPVDGDRIVLAVDTTGTDENASYYFLEIIPGPIVSNSEWIPIPNIYYSNFAANSSLEHLAISNYSNSEMGGIEYGGNFFVTPIWVADDSVDVQQDSVDNVVQPNPQGASTNFIFAYENVSQPLHGSVTVAPDEQSFRYTPDPGYTGPDAFSYWALFGDGGESTYSTAEATITINVVGAGPVVGYNCECDDPNPSRTLGELWQELLVRLGMSAQTASPAPGMRALLVSFLQGAQRQLYRQYNVLRTERFFTWDLEPGVRFYDLADNADVCTKELDPRMITWAGISDGDQAWRPLVCGIPPECYTNPVITSWPTRYEIRQCIELWPAPDNANLKLRIKGHFGLEPFALDTDRCTIDDEAVLLFALARAKAHYGHPDARNYQIDAMNHIRYLTAGSHQTRRYVPSDREFISEAPPVWVQKYPS